ncbi:MAG: PilZ domain-containing protein [Treponema sp.]|jgi:c-di-GMP-binding flagellar brake protein YcgR|nr:PilZ domain-containing protein [Treponema sp.]
MFIRGFTGFYLLQDVYFQSSGDRAPWIGPIVAGGIFGFFFVMIIFGVIKNRAGAPRRFSGFALRRIASAYGLNTVQRKVLEGIFRYDGVTDPVAVMESATLLDRHFKRAYQRIENTAEDDEDAQERFSLLFSARNAIESAQNTAGPVASTRHIPSGTAAALILGKETYQVRVANAKGDSVLVESPKNSLGSAIRIPNGSRVSLSFFTKTSKGYSFESRVIGTMETAKGPALKLAHVARVKPLVSRKYRRRQTSTPCSIAMVTLREERVRRKVVRKMVLDKRRYSGAIMDLSIGGCSIRCSAGIQPGARMKIEFSYGDSPSIAALGQVLRVNRGGMYTTIHVKFIKTPRRSQNLINAIVFEYTDY